MSNRRRDSQSGGEAQKRMRSNLISILMGWRDEKPRMEIDVSLHVSGWVLGEGVGGGGV